MEIKLLDYDHERDFQAMHRMYCEVGWLEDTDDQAKIHEALSESVYEGVAFHIDGRGGVRGPHHARCHAPSRVGSRPCRRRWRNHQPGGPQARGRQAGDGCSDRPAGGGGQRDLGPRHVRTRLLRPPRLRQRRVLPVAEIRPGDTQRQPAIPTAETPDQGQLAGRAPSSAWASPRPWRLCPARAGDHASRTGVHAESHRPRLLRRTGRYAFPLLLGRDPRRGGSLPP